MEPVPILYKSYASYEGLTPRLPQGYCSYFSMRAEASGRTSIAFKTTGSLFL